MSDLQTKIAFSAPAGTKNVHVQVSGPGIDGVRELIAKKVKGTNDQYVVDTGPLVSVGWRNGSIGGPNGEAPSATIYPLVGKVGADPRYTKTLQPLQFSVVGKQGGQKVQSSSFPIALTPFARPTTVDSTSILPPDAKLKDTGLIEHAVRDLGPYDPTNPEVRSIGVDAFIPREKYDGAVGASRDEVVLVSGEDFGKYGNVWVPSNMPLAFSETIVRKDADPTKSETLDVYSTTVRGTPGHAFTLEVVTPPADGEPNTAAQVHHLNNQGDDLKIP